MRLYRLVHRLSLVAGPLLLLDGDFPAPRACPRPPRALWSELCQPCQPASTPRDGCQPIAL